MTPHRMKVAQHECDGDGDAAYRCACNDMRADVRIVSFWCASCGRALLPFMLLVPLWGPLCVLLLHVRTLIRAGEHTAPDLEQMRVDDEERRSILVEERADFANTVPLEEALNEFERGVQLARQGQAKLQQAEQRVQILLSDNEDASLTPFTPDNE